MAFRLAEDETFHYEILRLLGSAYTHGVDVGEVLVTAAKVESGDFDSWAAEFYSLAERVAAEAARADTATKSGKVSARRASLRAASYYRTADFFLHGKHDDLRIMDYWVKHLACFDKGLSLFPNPGRRIEIPTPHGFHVPAIYFAGAGDGPKPTLIVGQGYDGSQEEMMHVVGLPAADRGFNVLTYEGPGQPTVRRYQKLGFVPNWEIVVTPIVDYLLDHAVDLQVDINKLALWGQSMGGMLGLRAVAFEKRIKAYIACDGVWNVDAALPKPFVEAVQSGRGATLWKSVADKTAPTGLRWLLEHAVWAMYDEGKVPSDEDGVPDLQNLIKEFQRYTIADVVDRVECKVFVAEAEHDLFFEGQPEKVAKALQQKAHYRIFRADEAAGSHCQAGATSLLNQDTLDWLERALA